MLNPSFPFLFAFPLFTQPINPKDNDLYWFEKFIILKGESKIDGLHIFWCSAETIELIKLIGRIPWRTRMMRVVTLSAAWTSPWQFSATNYQLKQGIDICYLVRWKSMYNCSSTASLYFFVLNSAVVSWFSFNCIIWNRHSNFGLWGCSGQFGFTFLKSVAAISLSTLLLTGITNKLVVMFAWSASHHMLALHSNYTITYSPWWNQSLNAARK